MKFNWSIGSKEWEEFKAKVRNKEQYETVLTGKVVGKTTKLIFGAVRLELTKKLKRRIAKK